MTDVQRVFAEHVKKGARIKLLGDSITHGVGGTGFIQNGEHIVADYSRNPDGYCWANRFASYIAEKYGATVTNNACTGTTIEFVIRHLDELVSSDDDLVICTIGTNNRHRYFNAGPRPEREEMLEEFYGNILGLYDMLCERGKAAILVANIPASAANERDGADYWRVLHMEDINAAYRRAERERGIYLVSMYERFIARCAADGIDPETLLCDGLHPNDRGYDVMYELMLEALNA
jgi:lysophospholipase L1-like esterase